MFTKYNKSHSIPLIGKNTAYVKFDDNIMTNLRKKKKKEKYNACVFNIKSTMFLRKERKKI